MRTRLIAAGTITAAAVVVFAATLVHATVYAPEPQAAEPALAASAPATQVTPQDLPTRLRIPAINVDANVQHVGIAASGDGAMAVPSNFTDAAWYEYGPVPGMEGSAVIDGHVDNALSLAGVFKHLSELKPGDDIYVDSASTTVHFVVTDVEAYPVSQVPLQQIFNKTGGVYLNLITCDGTWEENQKMYNERLVVYAERAPA
jgi:LPXTG-site transpeptidase (sortase) family protein